MPIQPRKKDERWTRALGDKLAPSSGYQQFNANVYDPSSMAQTGPGR